MSDDVEDDVDTLFVGGLDEVAELLASPEMRIDVEEVLDAVAVVARLEGDLAEDRADPQRGDAEPPQVAELALQPFESAALPRRRLPSTRYRSRHGRGSQACTEGSRLLSLGDRRCLDILRCSFPSEKGDSHPLGQAESHQEASLSFR